MLILGIGGYGINFINFVHQKYSNQLKSAVILKDEIVCLSFNADIIFLDTNFSNNIQKICKTDKNIAIIVGFGGSTSKYLETIVKRLKLCNNKFAVFGTTPFLFENNKIKYQAKKIIDKLTKINTPLYVYKNSFDKNALLNDVNSFFKKTDEKIYQKMLYWLQNDKL